MNPHAVPAVVAVALLAGCLQGQGVLPHDDCPYAAGLADAAHGWRIEANVSGAAPRTLATTDAGVFDLSLDEPLASNETFVRGAYGPPVRTGELDLTFAAPSEDGWVEVVVHLCGGEREGGCLRCDTRLERPGIAGEGHGHGFSHGSRDGACHYSLVLNADVFGRRDVLRWEATVAGGALAFAARANGA